MMLIRIDRHPLEPNVEHVFGSLSIDEERFCVTMEPPTREDGVFVPAECALPANHYNLSITWCRRFRCELPLLVAMPQNLERRASHQLLGMRIHPGIRVQDACAEIVVGRRRVGRTIVETVEAFTALMGAIEHAVRNDEAVEVQIHEGAR